MPDFAKSVMFLILLEKGLGFWVNVNVLKQIVLDDNSDPYIQQEFLLRNQEKKNGFSQYQDNMFPNAIYMLPKHPMFLTTTSTTSLSTTTSQPQCYLLNTFAQIIQAICALLSFSSLLIKRCQEKPRRPWFIWWADATKQLASGGAAHIVALYTASLVSSVVSGLSPCSWYFVAFCTDIAFGVPLSLILLKGVTWMLKKVDSDCVRKTVKSGDYEQKEEVVCGRVAIWPNWCIWLMQMSLWVWVCVIPARFCCTALVYSLRYQLAFIAAAISNFPYFLKNPQAELVFVMLAGPLILNSLQYLIQDAFLKFAKSLKRTKKNDDEGIPLTRPLTTGRL